VAVSYLRACRRHGGEAGRVRVRERWPELAAAHDLQEAGGPRLWEVQARLLAGQEDAAIADRCELPPGVVGRFERVFFNVRPRLQARDWIRLRAILPEARPPGRPRPDPGAAWRSLGYHGGPRVLDLALAVTRDEPLPAWATEGLGPGDDHLLERCRLVFRELVNAMLRPPSGTDPSALLRELHETRRLAAACRRRPPPTLAERVAAALAELELCPPRERRRRATA
jgi:hypothetical protein